MSLTENLSEHDIAKLYDEKKFTQIISSLRDVVIVDKKSFTNLPKDDKEKFQQLIRNYYYGRACCATLQFIKAIPSYHFAIVIGLEIYHKFKEDSKFMKYLFHSYFYKGMCLYTLNKYGAAIKCFKVVGKNCDKSVVANLFAGHCYEYFYDSEQSATYFKNALVLYENNTEKYDQYYDCARQARRALVTNLIRRNKFDELMELHGSKQVDHLDDTGNSLLMEAAYVGSSEVAEQLLHKNADPTFENQYGDSALSTARDYEHRCVISLFEDYLNNRSEE